MRTTLAVAAMLVVTLAAPAALPCGAPFGTGINADPRQDIIVVHKNGVETYVFQPRFCGFAREFGLVLPVPAKLSAQPELTPKAAFAKLTDLSQPQYEYVTACTPRWAADGGARADATAGGGNGPSVISSGTVGFMDYAQLDTVSTEALTAWLTLNGYPYDAQATAAFDYYVQKGWYFVTFRISQGIDGGVGTGCKDLGPVKLSFPTSTPVVPSRMATARSKDTSGSLASSTSFSWNIFGITDGSQQLVFTNTGPTSRAFKFSGLLGSEDAASMADLAVAGDRATKLMITFAYGATDPDIGLALGAGKDYREIITVYNYVLCNDGGTDARNDTGRDSISVLPQPDAGSPPADPNPTNPDALAIEPTLAHHSSGCSVTTSPGPGAMVPVMIAGMLLAFRRRR
jgi:MYXO-CTERM domain-containing protein